MEKWILKPGSDLDTLLEDLDDHVLFATEDEGMIEVIVKEEGLHHPFIASREPYILPETDWDQDWANHVDLKEGLLEIPLKNFTLKMYPGPGFGNLSHPTTQLMLEALRDLCFQKNVLDIGTGSGILALSAKALGANHVNAVDIDPQAITHAQKNAALNDLSITFTPPTSPPDLTLLNMIISEQKEALKDHPFKNGLLLSSGVLKEEEAAYLAFTQSQGWKHQSTFEKDGWLAFTFLAT